MSDRYTPTEKSSNLQFKICYVSISISLETCHIKYVYMVLVGLCFIHRLHSADLVSWCKRPVCALKQYYMCLGFVAWRDFLGGKVWYFPVLHRLSCFLANPQPKQMGRADDLLMKGLHAKQSASLYLPRRRQCRLLGIWGETGLRGRSPTGWEGESDTALLCCTPLGHRPWRRFKEEGCCFLLREKMLLRLDATSRWSGPDLTVKINDGGMRSDFVLLRQEDPQGGGEVWRLYPERSCNLFMRSWTVFPCRSEARRLN